MSENPNVILRNPDGTAREVALETTLLTRAADSTVNAVGVAIVSALNDILTELLAKTEPADQQHVIVDVTALPPDAATETTLLAIKAKTDNIDVALSTRTKPSDQQHVIVDSGSFSVVESTRQSRYDLSSTTVMYIGQAAQGALPSAAVWTIKKITFTAGGNPLQTTWSSTTAIWDNRALETYT
jgi:hypothetical protein